MPITGKWIFTAAMDVDPDKEALFNEVYDREHIPFLTKVPGVISATRFKLDTLRVTMGGETTLARGEVEILVSQKRKNPESRMGIGFQGDLFLRQASF